MAEFKNIFIKSKMNKDLDDRLLPQGEYRNAENIQVSKSESEDVGALENVLGNKAIINFEAVTGIPPGTAPLRTVGYHVSEVNSTVYFFLTNNTKQNNPTGRYQNNSSHFIVQSVITGDTAVNTVLVQGAFLNFWEGSPILGVNLLEDLLFFTDNRNQPRKINVTRAIQDVNYYVCEDTISVVKYMPYHAPVLWQESVVSPGDYETTMKDVVSEYLPDIEYKTTANATANPYYNPTYEGDPDYLEDKFVRFSYRFKFDDGEYSLFAPFTQECFIPKQDGYFLFQSQKAGISGSDNDMSNSYRSTVVDFMENKVNEITLSIPMPEIQDPALPTTNLGNVVDQFKITEIEILYKESDSVAALVVDVIPFQSITSQYDPNNPSNTFTYTYSATKPFRTLPESQITRVYDKAPVKALGQEVISNRIVYSNFQTKHTPPEGINYNVGTAAKQSFNVTLDPTTNPTSVGNTTTIVEYPNSSLKQNRNYQAGFVLSDRFGRTTSTILSNAGTGASADAASFSTVFSPYNEPPVAAGGIGPDVGQWPGDCLYIQVNDPIPVTPEPSKLYPGVYNGDPTSNDYNPLGFFSWKVVVKQQEQDYYNVYLPGIMAAYPTVATQELGVTSHTVLLNDNINKVPRDLAEVGPEQKQFRSSVQMFGRVENTEFNLNQAITPANFGVINRQYYPTIKSDTVSTISTVDDLFDPPQNPLPTEFEQFYEVDSNPLIARISTQKQIGQTVTAVTPPTSTIIRLGVYETEPVESRLDIYWETSTTGTITDLNTQVDVLGGQTIFDLAAFNWSFTEGFGLYTGNPALPEPGNCSPQPCAFPGQNEDETKSVIAGPFFAVNSVGVAIQNVGLVDFTVTNVNNVDVSSDFDVIKITGTANGGPGFYTDYKGDQAPAGQALAQDSFIVVNNSYKVWETNNTATRQFNFTIRLTDDSQANPPVFQITKTYLDGVVMDDRIVKIRGWNSVPGSPSTAGAITQPIAWQPITLTVDSTVVPFAYLGGALVQFFAVNGSNDLSSNPRLSQVGLVWSIAAVSQNQQSIVPGTYFTIDQTGSISEVNVGSASGSFNIKVQCTGPDGTIDVFDFTLVFGEVPADGSFLVENQPPNQNFIISDRDEAMWINAHNDTSTTTQGQLTILTAYAQNGLYQNAGSVGVFPSPTGGQQNQIINALSGFAIANCNSQFINPQAFGNISQVTAYHAQNSNNGAGLSQGTAFAKLEININNAGYSTGVNPQSRVSWVIERRATNQDPWEAATDIEGNILSWNTSLNNSQNNTMISGSAADGYASVLTKTQPYNKQEYGAVNKAGSPGFGPAMNNNQLGVSVTGITTAETGVNYNQLIFTRWVAFGEVQNPLYQGFVPNCLGEFRIIVTNLGGSDLDCVGCGNTSIGQPAYQFGTTSAELTIGDFYYGIGNYSNRAYQYKINPVGFATRQAAEQATGGNYTQVFYAREPIARYVSSLYTDVNLSIPLAPQLNWGAQGTNTYFSIIAGDSIAAGSQLPGGATTNSNNIPADKLILNAAMESAAYNQCGGLATTTQNLREWVIEIQNNQSIKVLRSSQPVSCDW